MLRSYIFSLLTNDSVLNGLGFDQDSCFTTHDVDTPRHRPVMILRWQRTDPGLGDEVTQWSNYRRLQVWVHDKPGDYSLIDKALQRVRDVLSNVYATYTGTDGMWVTQTNWEGFSEDLRDDDMDTITRNGQFLFVGSAA